MTIEYLGHASFLLTTDAGTRIVIDPFDPKAYTQKAFGYRAFQESADIVTISHDHHDHNAAHEVKGSPIIIKGNGKFIAKEVEFEGVGTWHDDARGAKRGGNTVFIISVDNLRIAHLGDLGHVLTADQAAQIGNVDIAMIPVGGTYTINAAQAWEVAAQIDAQIIIPMHYHTQKCDFPIAGVEEFVKGHPRVTRMSTTTLDINRENIAKEQSVVILEPRL